MDVLTLHDETVPALGLGTWRLRGDPGRAAVETALEMGYRNLDTAQAYGNESEVGAAITAAGIDPDDLFVTTKVPEHKLEPDDVSKAAHESLGRLGLDRIDLLLIHWPADDHTNARALEQMFRLRDEGLVRHVGVSNFNISQVRRALEVGPIACNQVEYHPYLSQARLLDVTGAHGIALTAYAPLARGRVFSDPVLTEIGERHGKSPAQVTLRWLLDQPGVMAIPKASSRDHLADNLDIFDFALDDAERERIAGLARSQRLIDPPSAPDWER